MQKKIAIKFSNYYFLFLSDLVKKELETVSFEKDVRNDIEFSNEAKLQLFDGIRAIKPIIRVNFAHCYDTWFKCTDGALVGAHRCILMARSEFFEAALGHRWTTVSHRIQIYPIVLFNIFP